MATSARMRRSLVSLAGLVLAGVLFVAINVISSTTLSGVRFDLTRDRLYTLSAGTRALLGRIEEPITLRYYYSERLGREIPSYAILAGRIRDMLREYVSAAGGKIRLELIDPRPFTDEEDRAVALGIQSVPVNQAGELVYFGLAGTHTTDKQEAIAFFQPDRERFLEYDITKLVNNLVVARKKSIGLLTTLPLQGEFRGPRAPPEPWAIYNQMQQFFDIKRVEPTATEIPGDIGVLVVAHPKALGERTLYAIDQYVLGGGRALIFVDPHSEGEMTRPGIAAQTGVTNSELGPLFKAWGLEMAEDKLAGDRAIARRVNAGTNTSLRAVDYVLWLNLRDTNLNRGDIVTADTDSINVASAGILKASATATTDVTPLIETGPQSMAIDAQAAKFAPDPVGLLASFSPSGQRMMIAARVRGSAKTAFPDGPPPEPNAEGETAPAATAPPTPPASHLAQSREPINLIVVADTDMLEDRFWAQVQDFFGQRVITPIAGNGNFVVNAIDNLTGSNELIGLRSRGEAARPFLVVQDLQREAELRFRTKERELTEKLRDTEKKLSDLQAQGQGPEQGARALVTRAQQDAIDQFRGEMIATRKELRDVQHELRKDIETLEAWLKFVNIALVPLLVAVLAVIVGVLRVRRRRPASAAAAATG
jgi:ABC-type uncharacterized transport system involved in gliding motility auxiliary subunit